MSTIVESGCATMLWMCEQQKEKEKTMLWMWFIWTARCSKVFHNTTVQEGLDGDGTYLERAV